MILMLGPIETHRTGRVPPLLYEHRLGATKKQRRQYRAGEGPSKRIDKLSSGEHHFTRREQEETRNGCGGGENLTND